MQAFADRAAVSETLQTGCVLVVFFVPPPSSWTRSRALLSLLSLTRAHAHNPPKPTKTTTTKTKTTTNRLATFYSRSRAERWCKGETSGHYIKVARVFHDCDRDSLIYLGEPVGPACHPGAR